MRNRIIRAGKQEKIKQLHPGQFNHVQWFSSDKAGNFKYCAAFNIPTIRFLPGYAKRTKRRFRMAPDDRAINLVAENTLLRQHSSNPYTCHRQSYNCYD
jgi:hypothetical protein